MTIPFEPAELLELYRRGIFLMNDSGRIKFFCPDPRGVIFPRHFHIPHGTRRTLRDPAWECRVDTCFEDVIRGCAARSETWICPVIRESFVRLHQAGWAHSVEIFRDGRLAGGLYGVRLGAVFFGESMFHRVSGASKVALVKLMDILRAGGFGLLEIQWVTPHLRRFGATEISHEEYMKRLRWLVKLEARWPPPGRLQIQAGG